jgi:hypothetical protein
LDDQKSQECSHVVFPSPSAPAARNLSTARPSNSPHLNVRPNSTPGGGNSPFIQLGGNGRVALSAKNRRYVGRKLPGDVFDDDIAQNPRLSHLEIAQFLFLKP